MDDALRNLVALNGTLCFRSTAVTDDLRLDDQITRDRLKALITSELVTDTEKHQILQKSLKTFSPTMPLCWCAVCGIQNYDPKSTEFIDCEMNASVAGRLRVTDVEIAAWHALWDRAAKAPPGQIGRNEDATYIYFNVENCADGFELCRNSKWIRRILPFASRRNARLHVRPASRASQVSFVQNMSRITTRSPERKAHGAQVLVGSWLRLW